MSAFYTLIRRDLRLAWRNNGALVTSLGFYLIVIAILPLGLGPDLNLLARLAPGLLWVALLLSALLTLDRLFHNDFEDGSLELIVLGPLPLELVCFAKSLSHWISSSLPLALLAPGLGLLLNLDANAYWVLTLTTFVGTPAISFIGAIGAALTIGLRQGGPLLALIVLPLYVPVLVFGVSAINAVIVGPNSFWASFSILCAITLASMVLAPLAAAAGLRLNVQ